MRVDLFTAHLRDRCFINWIISNESTWIDGIIERFFQIVLEMNNGCSAISSILVFIQKLLDNCRSYGT